MMVCFDYTNKNGVTNLCDTADIFFSLTSMNVDYVHKCYNDNLYFRCKQEAKPRPCFSVIKFYNYYNIQSVTSYCLPTTPSLIRILLQWTLIHIHNFFTNKNMVSDLDLYLPLYIFIKDKNNVLIMLLKISQK